MTSVHNQDAQAMDPRVASLS